MTVVETKKENTIFGCMNYYVKTDKGYYYMKNPHVGTKRISKEKYESVK